MFRERKEERGRESKKDRVICARAKAAKTWAESYLYFLVAL
jgi:hypothetical protein